MLFKSRSLVDCQLVSFTHSPEEVGIWLVSFIQLKKKERKISSALASSEYFAWQCLWGLPYLTCGESLNPLLFSCSRGLLKTLNSIHVQGKRNRVIRIESTKIVLSDWLEWLRQSDMQAVASSAWYSLLSLNTLHFCLSECVWAFSWGSWEGKWRTGLKMSLQLGVSSVTSAVAR